MKKLWWLGIALAGCGLVAAPGTPAVVAHRAGAGMWPENSRTAVRNSLERGFPGIEIDLLLTRDLLPVLHHDTSLSSKSCVTAAGATIEGQVFVQDLTLAELQQGYRCGGIEDPTVPGSERVADSLMTFSEVIDALRDHPETIVHLDIKFEPGQTPPAEDFARVILDAWHSAALPNPWYASSKHEELVVAFEARPPVTTTLQWPKFTEGKSNTVVALESDLLSSLGLRDAIGLARSIGAEGLSVPYQVIDRQTVELARREGLAVQVWTVNSAAALGRFCAWPIDVLITDYPERAPCL